MKYMRVIFCLFAFSFVFSFAHILEDFSFNGPYENISLSGQRFISDKFKTGRVTKVLEHFIRLTPDRQSQIGFIWSNNTFDGNEFSAILTFRISGQGKFWFGDGIAIWFTNVERYKKGPNHGSTESYTGIGIILDTFINPENKGGHKDITIQYNGGTKNIDMLNEQEKIGCDAKIRFHEGTDSFDPVHSSSRVKIQMKNNHIVLNVDEKGAGDWKKCYEGDIPPNELPRDWANKLSVGITAATGSLADNHDILRLAVYTKADDEEHSYFDSDSMIHSFSKSYNEWIESDSCGTDCKIAILQKNMKNFKVEYEHRVTDLKEKISNTISKLRAQELENEYKIQIMERKFGRMVEKKIDKQFNEIGDKVEEKIEKKLVKTLETSEGNAGWKIPFFLLVLVLGGGIYFLYRKYLHLRKSHLL